MKTLTKCPFYSDACGRATNRVGFLFNMKDISKLTKEQIEFFILGVQETIEYGDYIDPRKDLQWTVTEIPSGWSIKVTWTLGVTHYPASNPMTDREAEYHIDDYYFQILNTESKRKLCKEVVDAIEVVNENEFKIV